MKKTIQFLDGSLIKAKCKVAEDGQIYIEWLNSCNVKQTIWIDLDRVEMK